MRPLIRQAIQTTYRGATNTKPSSIRAVAEARSITVSWDHALDQADNHRAAAEQLAARLGWSGRLIGGGLRGASYAWVFMPEAEEAVLRELKAMIASFDASVITADPMLVSARKAVEDAEAGR